MSAAALPVGFRLNFSTNMLVTLSLMKPGSCGPKWMSVIPRCNNDSKTATAFCSNHDTQNDNGSQFTEHSKAPAKATAT